MGIESVEELIGDPSPLTSEIPEGLGAPPPLTSEVPEGLGPMPTLETTEIPPPPEVPAEQEGDDQEAAEGADAPAVEEGDLGDAPDDEE